MKLTRLSPYAHAVLIAGLLAGAAAAQAAVGYAVTPFQETQVAPNMTTAQVRQVLGQPERQIHYRNEPGPTFTYEVAGSQGMLFDVDFDAAGRVISMGERMDDLGN
ncbi:hypothetical protein [Hydrogenophaga sp.]|uniref:hypothetical protein n=1 Tax=Hydrogenophaga sp. TaxID=1904254 RepID=UPI002728EC7C|nr:hypothetical protein [Hydrogenophaga sp.]MDO9438858.1 hypothetical protein [Hydrogenophaga sp.]